MSGTDTRGWEIDVHLEVGPVQLHVELTTDHPIVAIVGPNGAGKTTLLRAIAGAVRPHAGRIALRGRVLHDSAAGIDVPIEARHLGYVPQGYGLFSHLDAADNVAFGLRVRDPSMPRIERRTRARELLARVGADAIAERRPVRLSGGERQRVALARALAIDPAGLLLDEPLAALDVAARRTMRVFLAERLHEGGLPALVVTHDPRDARALDAEVVVLEAGRIVQRGRPDTLAAEPATAFVDELFAHHT
jgi:molybdate transport system ATP-binding protein